MRCINLSSFPSLRSLGHKKEDLSMLVLSAWFIQMPISTDTALQSGVFCEHPRRWSPLRAKFYYLPRNSTHTKLYHGSAIYLNLFCAVSPYVAHISSSLLSPSTAWLIRFFRHPPHTRRRCVCVRVQEKAVELAKGSRVGNSCCTNRITARLINGCPPRSLSLLLLLSAVLLTRHYQPPSSSIDQSWDLDRLCAQPICCSAAGNLLSCEFCAKDQKGCKEINPFRLNNQYPLRMS